MMPKTEEDTRGREEDQTAANASLPPRRRGARDDDDASRFVSPLVTRPALLLVHGCQLRNNTKATIARVNLKMLYHHYRQKVSINAGCFFVSREHRRFACDDKTWTAANRDY